MAIRGWSASGYTTLAALTFRDLFRAGASHFGISDLETMATDTHKFESRYLDGLIGPYPERKDIYKERSPIHHIEWLHRAADPLPGARGHGRAARPGGDDVRGADGQGLPVAWSSSRASSTASAAPRTSAAPWKASSTSTARSSASPRTARSSRCRSRI